MRRLHAAALTIAALASACSLIGAQAAPTQGSVVVTPPLTLPYSAFGSSEAQALFARLLRERHSAAGPGPDIASQRRFYGAFNDAQLAEMRRDFSTRVDHKTLGGVGVDIVTPSAGVPAAHRDKVLINLHAGAFMWGSGSGALVEAIPISAVGGYTVVAVEYRLAPEHRYPAASEDVAAVYRELLKTYRPENIGLYGCSAGGILTAQAVAWFQVHDLPTPGAIGTFCGSGLPITGDSIVLGTAADGETPAAGADLTAQLPYLAGVKADDPQAYPGVSPAVLARFPPTLLITGSRDMAESSTATMARRLAAAGVYARLQVFDGMWHAFFIYPELPESQEAYRLIARFFDQELGRGAH